jgi:hypothetical protein
MTLSPEAMENDAKRPELHDVLAEIDHSPSKKCLPQNDC